MDGIKFFLSDGCQLFVHCFFLVSAGELRVRFLFEDGWKPGEFAQEKREIINAIYNRWMGLNFFYQMVVNFLFIVSFW